MAQIFTSELGPIRPPSESHSLLIRLSRNCPWNRCLFCPVYKGNSFSIRALPELIDEISFLASIKNTLQELLKTYSFRFLSLNLAKFFETRSVNDAHRILHWLYHDEYTIFLQDADPLLRKPDEIIKIMSTINILFPEVTRVTAYARATTILRIPKETLKVLRSYRLSRIHMGLESGSNQVLNYVKKGIKKEDVILASNKLAEADIQLSLYVMPGLGGKSLQNEHITETIDAINNSKPAFVRLRTLALNPTIPLYNLYMSGEFLVPSEEELVIEIKQIVSGIIVPVFIFSDHTLNLLMDINGFLPDDKSEILKKIDRFLSLQDDLKLKFILSRRLNSVFELNEFLNIKPDSNVLQMYEKISVMNKTDREKLFLELRSNSL